MRLTSTTDTLRPYQREALEAMAAAHKRQSRILLSLPTGTGKTRVAATYAMTHFIGQGRPVLWIAHTQELLDQAQAAFEQLGLRPSHIAHRYAGRDELEAKPNALLCLMSVACTTGPERADLIVVDEAHHAAAQTYKDWLSIYRTFARDGTRSKLLGLTATPYRLHEGEVRPLTDFTFSSPKVPVFESLCYHKSFVDLAAEGFLAPFRHVAWSTGMSFRMSLAKTGEFTNPSLESLNNKVRNRFIVEHWRKEQFLYGKTLVFVGTRSHARDLAEEFPAGVAGYAVSGSDMSKEERGDAIDDFRAGRIQVLVNVGILKEGVDVPDIQTVILARPTTSPGAYVQMVGRGSRRLPGKEFFYLVDVHDQLGEYEKYLIDPGILGNTAGDFIEGTVSRQETQRRGPRNLSAPSVERLAGLGIPAVRSIAGWIGFVNSSGKPAGGLLLGDNDFAILHQLSSYGELRSNVAPSIPPESARLIDVRHQLTNGVVGLLHPLPQYVRDASPQIGASIPWQQSLARWAWARGVAQLEIDCALAAQALRDEAPIGMLAVGGTSRQALFSLNLEGLKATILAIEEHSRNTLPLDRAMDWVRRLTEQHPRLRAFEMELLSNLASNTLQNALWQHPDAAVFFNARGN